MMIFDLSSFIYPHWHRQYHVTMLYAFWHGFRSTLIIPISFGTKLWTLNTPTHPLNFTDFIQEYLGQLTQSCEHTHPPSNFIRFGTFAVNLPEIWQFDAAYLRPTNCWKGEKMGKLGLNYSRRRREDQSLVFSEKYIAPAPMYQDKENKERGPIPCFLKIYKTPTNMIYDWHLQNTNVSCYIFGDKYIICFYIYICVLHKGASIK